jgi:hypothetical protein
MKYYKDNQGNVYAYESDGSQDHLIENKTLIEKQEVDIFVDLKKKEQISLLTYAEKRILEYPSIGDQLDALFHAGVFPESMAAQIQIIKDKYPKS